MSCPPFVGYRLIITKPRETSIFSALFLVCDVSSSSFTTDNPKIEKLVHALTLIVLHHSIVSKKLSTVHRINVKMSLPEQQISYYSNNQSDYGQGTSNIRYNCQNGFMLFVSWRFWRQILKEEQNSNLIFLTRNI